jgi:hypothetical protein
MIVMPEYTTTEAAALLRTARRNVQNYAKRHGLRKFGREYVVTDADIEGMRAELGKPGPKSKNAIENKKIAHDIAHNDDLRAPGKKSKPH